MASKPESTLQKTMVGVPEYVATSYVGLSAGVLPGISSVDSYPSAHTGSVQTGTFPMS